MVVAPKAPLQKIGDLLLQVNGCSVSPAPEDHNRSIVLDFTFSSIYISHLSQNLTFSPQKHLPTHSPTPSMPSSILHSWAPPSRIHPQIGVCPDFRQTLQLLSSPTKLIQPILLVLSVVLSDVSAFFVLVSLCVLKGKDFPRLLVPSSTADF